MKLALAPLGVLVVLAAVSMGCSPAAARAPAGNAGDVLAAMEAELAHAIPGTTTLTSAEFRSDLPETRGSLAQAFEAEVAAKAPSNQATQTWGAPEQPAQPKSVYEP